MAADPRNVALSWAVCLVHGVDGRELVLVAPGEGLRGVRVLETDDGDVARRVLRGISDPHAAGGRVPRAGGATAIVEAAREMEAEILEGRYRRRGLAR